MQIAGGARASWRRAAADHTARACPVWTAQGEGAMDLEMETEQVGEEQGYGYGEGYDHGSEERSEPWEADNGLHGAAGAAGGSFDDQGNDPYAPKVALSGLVLHPESANGTHVIKVGVQVH